MSERVTASQAARLLDGADHILILTHQFPDGDTLGSGFALCLALRKLGKTVRVACSDPIPEKYEYMTAHIPMPDFEPAYVCAVDVADVKLLGGLSVYGDRVDLCICLLYTSGIACVAEGVETREQLHILQEMGCTAIQGYLFSRPLPPDAFEKFAGDFFGE